MSGHFASDNNPANATMQFNVDCFKPTSDIESTSSPWTFAYFYNRPVGGGSVNPTISQFLGGDTFNFADSSGLNVWMQWQTNAGGVGAGANITLIGNSYLAGKIIVPAGGAPATAGSNGLVGTIAWDNNFIYVCVATNTWKRVAVATW
jgi:hypothetical protein